MKKFLVKINAYDHYAVFEVEAEDNAKSIENSILDKIGEKSISGNIRVTCMTLVNKE